ncbi:hypothetical protein [Hymenobacter sp. AT01-02]|uniref:hypothetical protein n=1 Tax=Hymenobacter sp. AT01-02 TaxID=1571877 RepID=UPI0013791AC6|nr:hypothetical protein [Hymenobacter sp. AT01-02]
MLKNFLLVLLPLLVLLSGVGSVAQAQICFATPNSGADFQVYEPGGREPLQVLCVGKTVRLKDASERRLNPAQVYYQKGATIVCSGFTDTTTFYTPTTPGQVVITQNTQNPQPGQSGLFLRVPTK